MIDKSQILKGYLGPYAKRPSEDVLSLFLMESCEKNLFVFIPGNVQNEVITYLVMKEGRKNYKVFTAFDLIEIYLGKREEYTSLLDLMSDVLFVKVSRFDSPNQRRWDIVRQLCIARQSRGLPTVVLTDDKADFIPFRDMGFMCLEKKGRLKTPETEEEF